MDFLESEWFQKLGNKKRELCYGIGFLVVLILIIGYFFERSSYKKLDELATAKQYAQQLKNNSKLFPSQTEIAKSHKEIFTDLKILAERDKEVRSQFNGLIAEEMMLSGDINNLDRYASTAVGQLQRSNLPLYADFSEMSYLMSKNRPREALSLAQKIQETKNLSSSYPMLYAFTLLQQAAIQKQLGKQEDALQTIALLKKSVNYEAAPGFSAFQRPDSDAMRFVNHMQDKQESILDYLTNNK